MSVAASASRRSKAQQPSMKQNSIQQQRTKPQPQPQESASEVEASDNSSAEDDERMQQSNSDNEGSYGSEVDDDDSASNDDDDDEMLNDDSDALADDDEYAFNDSQDDDDQDDEAQSDAESQQQQELLKASDSDDNLNAQEPKTSSQRHADRQPLRDGSRSFGETLNALLSQQQTQETSKLLQAASLQRLSAIQKRKATEMEDNSTTTSKLSARALKQRKIERRMRLQQERITQPQQTPVEQSYIKLATRGVVTLFNAIQRQQRKAHESALGLDVKPEVKQQSIKSQALDSIKQEDEDEQRRVMQQQQRPLIKTESASQVGNALLIHPHKRIAPKADANKETAVAPASGWGALRDDYMMTSKLTDWDKLSDESDNVDGAD
jgi:hypothetical protein